MNIAKILVIILLTSFPSFGQTGKLFDCNYDYFSSLDNLKVKTTNQNIKFILNDDGTATKVGNNGTAKVLVRETSESINFIETTGFGNINLTTIDMNLVSSHSRHVVIYGELVPSQYYGKCKLK